LRQAHAAQSTARAATPQHTERAAAEERLGLVMTSSF
jgi:hypothetical protein